MELLHPRCAGLDVHKDSVVACIRIQQGPQAVHQLETFGTTTKSLLQLSDWLSEHQVTHVAMEATGVYIGSRYGTCWMGPSSWCWPTRCTLCGNFSSGLGVLCQNDALVSVKIKSTIVIT